MTSGFALAAQPAFTGTFTVVPQPPAPKFTHLGDVDEAGNLYTTCGWINRGTAWVTAEQIAPAERHGWRKTGHESPFMGTTLYAVTK